MEESDEHVLLRALRRFVEDSDQSMWIAGTAKPTTSKLLEIKILTISGGHDE
jgi:hypothetical protein